MTVVSLDRQARIAALGYDYLSQPREAVDACNLCGASAFVVLTHRDRYGYPTQAHACARCGLVFLNPRLTARAYARFYDGVYRPLVSAYHGRLIDALSVQAEQRVYAADRAEFIRPFVENAGFETLLDIGGSTGVVAHQFAHEFGLKATLIDPAPLEIEQARRYGLEAITGLVEQHDFGRRRFDIIVLCQTIDHLLDVSGTLARVRQLLTDRGCLFLDIVDFRAAYLREWSVESAIKIDHPYYLTEFTIEAYLRRAGLEVLRTDYAADHLHIGYVCRPGGAMSDAMPPPGDVKAMLQEIRFVENASRA